MTEEVTTLLTWFAGQLETTGLHYAFGQWAGTAVYPYFVGEAVSHSATLEDGHCAGTLTLNGWSRRGYGELLEQVKQLREAVFPLNGMECRAIVDGKLVYLRYEGLQSIPTGEDGLVRLQVRMGFDLWG